MKDDLGETVNYPPKVQRELQRSALLHEVLTAVREHPRLRGRDFGRTIAPRYTVDTLEYGLWWVESLGMRSARDERFAMVSILAALAHHDRLPA